MTCCHSDYDVLSHCRCDCDDDFDDVFVTCCDFGYVIGDVYDLVTLNVTLIVNMTWTNNTKSSINITEFTTYYFFVITMLIIPQMWQTAINTHTVHLVTSTNFTTVLIFSDLFIQASIYTPTQPQQLLTPRSFGCVVCNLETDWVRYTNDKEHTVLFWPEVAHVQFHLVFLMHFISAKFCSMPKWFNTNLIFSIFQKKKQLPANQYWYYLNFSRCGKYYVGTVGPV